MDGTSPQLVWLVSGPSRSGREKAKEPKESVSRLVRVKRGERVGCGCGFHGPPWELNSWPEHSHSIRTWNKRHHVCTSLRRCQHSWNGERRTWEHGILALDAHCWAEKQWLPVTSQWASSPLPESLVSMLRVPQRQLGACHCPRAQSGAAEGTRSGAGLPGPESPCFASP